MRRVPPAISALGFLTNSLSTGRLASKTRLKNPIIISSQLWSPQVTSFVGSAASGLFGELSKCAVQSILRAFRQRDRLLEVVPVLPVPVEVRHLEQDVGLAGRKHRAVLEVLAASVHVRMQAGERDVRAHFEARVDAIVRITRRNLERAVDGRQREDALLRRLLGEDDAESRAIGHAHGRAACSASGTRCPSRP